MQLSLPAITALARSGAMARAWEAFVQGGWADRTDDPAAMAVKGRLLKDRALGAAGGPDRSGLLAAAQAYAAAHKLEPAPYLLINVATLHALAGEDEQAQEYAAEVLRLLADDPAETPYYIAATRAEAHLLRGDLAAAQTALAEALRCDPAGWFDRATTIRQLERICAAQDRDCTWLDASRPPASLHFVGHMGIAPEGRAERELADAVDRLIASERIGFGYGALAAGADIVIAERVLAAGAELHVILPLPLEDFVNQSVDAEGSGWRVRFERLIAASASIQCVTRVPGAFEPLATALAGTVAMGRARLNADVLVSTEHQLVVLDQENGGANTALQMRRWAETGSRQHVLTVARDDSRFVRAESAVSPEGRVLCALLHIALPPGDGDLGARFAPLRQAAACARLFAMGDGSCWLIGLSSIGDALAMASSLADANIALTVHYGIVSLAEDPLTGATVAAGYDAELCRALALETANGAFAASESFAAALAMDGKGGWRAEPLGQSDHAAVERFALMQI